MMTSTMRRGLLAVFAVGFVISLSLGTLSAQQSSQETANGYKISPVRSELNIDKGRSATIDVTINNPSQLPTTARAVVNNFLASDDETGTPRLILDDKVPTPKNDFIKLVEPIADVRLKPGESKTVTVKVSVPEGANSGGYYGAIRFVPADAEQQSTVGLTASVGTLVLVTVPGNLLQKLSLQQLTASQNGKATSFITGGEVEIMARLLNDGDIHLQPFGRVEVTDMFNKTVASYELNNTDPRANILPGSTRKFVDKVENKKWFGRYKITANVAAAQGTGDLVTKTVSFWYLPVWSLIVLAALILAIVLGVVLLVRKLQGSKRSRR